MINKVKQRLAEGQLCLGGWMQIGHPAVAEIMVSAGFDWIAVDEEHGVIDLETGMNIFNVIRNTDTVTMVRVQENDNLIIRRWLDAGAQGIIVPMVNTAQQAEAAVQSAKYPPHGKRGFAFCRANHYGAKFDTYVQEANDDIVLIAQIEHTEAIRNIDAILDVKGIDGAFIGPYDLSGSMGLTGQTSHPDVLAAIQTMLEACRRHNKAAGIHIVSVDSSLITEFIKKGFTFIALSIDCVMLRNACEKVLQKEK